jgi:hypothetical protein
MANHERGTMSLIGAPIQPCEDDPLLRETGKFVGDLRLPAVLASAIDDAPRPWGVWITRLPIHPQYLRKLLTQG